MITKARQIILTTVMTMVTILAAAVKTGSKQFPSMLLNGIEFIRTISSRFFFGNVLFPVKTVSYKHGSKVLSLFLYNNPGDMSQLSRKYLPGLIQ